MTEGADCAQLICQDPDVSSRYSVDRFGGYVKAFDCANPCGLSCQRHQEPEKDGMPSLSTIGWTVADRHGRTLFVDDTANDEPFWDAECPERVCSLTSLKYKFVKSGDDGNGGDNGTGTFTPAQCGESE